MEKRFAGLDITDAHQAGMYQVPSWVNFGRSGSVARIRPDATHTMPGHRGDLVTRRYQLVFAGQTSQGE